MNVEYISDTGSRHEWKCVHCDHKYVVTYHYLDEAWSVQRVRDDGQREIIDRKEADELLGLFPSEEALSLTQSDTKDAARSDAGGFTQSDSRPSGKASKDIGPLPIEDRGSLGSSTRSKGESASDPDASKPVA